MKNKSANKTLPAYTRIPPIIICTFMCVFVLFTLPVEIILGFDEQSLVPCKGGEGIVDFCLRGRELLTFAAGLAILLFWAGERVFPDKPIKSAFFEKRAALLPVLCGTYLLWVVLSSIIGEHRSISFLGFPSESEGIAAVIGYLALFLGGYEYFHTKRSIKTLGNAVFIMSALIDILFIIERFTKPLMKLLYAVEDERTGTALAFGNSANCGAVCAIIFVAAIGFTALENNKPLKCIKSLLSGGVLLIIITTYSSAAFYGVLFGTLCTVILLIATHKIRIKSALLQSALIALPIVAFAIISPKAALSYISSDIANKGVYSAEGNFELESISAENGRLLISDLAHTLTITSPDGEEFVFSDDTGELARLSDGTKTLGEPFEKITATADDGFLTLDLGYESPISFMVYEGSFEYVGINGYLNSDFSQSAFPELSQYYSFGTGRGYIWLNSLPIILENPIFGCGAGQFAYHFPQNDIVGLLNVHGNAALLTDKPHCMYIGYAVSYGIPALGIALAIFFVVLKKGFICCLDKTTASPEIYAGLIGSVVCFLLMGIVNDSTPAVSPLFWIIAGVAARGCACEEN